MSARKGSSQFIFLDYLRIIAAWAVVWDHVFCSWPESTGLPLQEVLLVRRYITAPLAIIQDFGWTAVSIFFLVSGFIITHVADRETIREIIVKRICRIFPLLIIFVIIQVILTPDLRVKVDLKDIVLNITLIKYFTTSSVIILGFAWTLAIELVFYILTISTMWCRCCQVSIAFNLLVPAISIATCRRFGADFFLLSANLAYVPYLVVGQIIYLGIHKKTISMSFTTISMLFCFMVIYFGIVKIHSSFLSIHNSYLINFLYALLIFIFSFAINDQLKDGRLIKFLSGSSYAIYLVHGVVGRAAFISVWPILGIRAAICAAVVSTMIVSTGSHLLIEKPIMRLGRRMSTRLRPNLIASTNGDG